MNTELTYNGDSEYTIQCTGDAVTGDEIAFERTTFAGSYKSPKFAGYELVKGKIIKDSYGAEKQQHTFTIQLENGEKTRIKGRNLYANKVWRKPWADEKARETVAEEKHERGAYAREERAQRREMGW